MATKKKKKSTLTPPDLECCQAEKPGNGPFTMGGEIGDPLNGYRVRCRNKPTVIATEKKAINGKKGSMSLCNDCKKVLLKQMGKDTASFKKIPVGVGR